MKNNSIIITSNRFPDGDAGALRQHVFAKILLSLGYNVTVYGMGPSTDKKFYEIDDFKYISLRGTSQRTINRIIDRLTWDYKALSDIKKRFDKVDVFIIVDDNPIFLKIIERCYRHLNCVLIHDSVEWYSSEEFNAGAFSIQYLVKNFMNRHSFNKNWNIIAISSYLNNWFSDKVYKTIRIPVIMDINKIEPSYEYGDNSEKIRIVYAGSPGKKDYLKEIILGFVLLDKKEIESFEFHIIGITYEKLVSVCGIDPKYLEKLKHSVFVHGRLDHQKAIEWVKRADYTILLRDQNLRYAKAGFPTKIVESMMCGTPPICNLSSDLDEYLTDGKNSIIINSCSARDVKNALKKTISICSEKYKSMRSSARETAREYFDYSRYINSFADFLKKNRTNDDL